MDEGESNSEPAESMILLSKDAEEKDPLSIALPETPSSDTQTKEENDQRSPSDVATPDDEADIPAQSSKTSSSSSSSVVNDDEKRDGDKKILPAVNAEIKSEKDSGSVKDVKDIKEQEMLSKLANMKQENNLSSIDGSGTGEFQTKDSSSTSSTSTSSMLIKKEPSLTNEEENANSQQQPADLKVKIEIKSEKNGSGSSSSNISNSNSNSSSSSSVGGVGGNNVTSDISNQMPNEQDNNNNAENLVCKPIEKLSALSSVVSGNVATGGSSNDSSSKSDERPLTESGTDYTMKTFMEQQQRDGIKIEQNLKSEGQNKSPVEGPKPQVHPFSVNAAMERERERERDREDGKFGSSEPPHGLLRHPYEPLMKFDPMMKYELPHPAMDLKYLPPDHPARAYAESVALKSQFSADNLIKGSSHYPTDLKYQPGVPPPPPSSSDSQGPLDASRVTPNQDSQGSNSNSQPATLPSPSPATGSISSVSAPPPSSLFVTHPGLLQGGPIPGNHPSLLGAAGLPPSLSASSLVSSSSPFLPIPGLHRPDPIPSTASRSFASTITTAAISSSSISSAGSAFGPGGSSLYSRPSDSNGRDGIPHRSSPLGPLLHGAPHPLLSHPLPLHLGHPGLAGLPPPPHPAAHLPPHLHNHLMQPLGANTPLPLIGGPPQPSSNPLSSLIEAAGRRTPNSSTIPSSLNHIGGQSQQSSNQAVSVSSSSSSSSSQQQQHNSNNAITSSSNNALNSASSLSRNSPLVHPSSSGAFSHRPQSPSSNHPANLSRNSPLHLGGGQPLGPSPAAISAERERHLMRQQSPHMTPPPSSSSSSLVASPLSKM